MISIQKTGYACFNPRSREGSDLRLAFLSSRLTPRFNPRSREGSDTHDAMILGPFCVSIHAPARGATVLAGRGARPIRRFNPRSREGSDLLKKLHAIADAQFQSTLPRGERPCGPGTQRHAQSVSIHAPARGATTIPPEAIPTHSRFNPRSREGSDSRASACSIFPFRFQSTLPRGERPSFWISGSM